MSLISTDDSPAFMLALCSDIQLQKHLQDSQQKPDAPELSFELQGKKLSMLLSLKAVISEKR